MTTALPHPDLTRPPLDQLGAEIRVLDAFAAKLQADEDARLDATLEDLEQAESRWLDDVLTEIDTFAYRILPASAFAK
jgi:hypothetical protein